VQLHPDSSDSEDSTHKPQASTRTQNIHLYGDFVVQDPTHTQLPLSHGASSPGPYHHHHNPKTSGGVLLNAYEAHGAPLPPYPMHPFDAGFPAQTLYPNNTGLVPVRGNRSAAPAPSLLYKPGMSVSPISGSVIRHHAPAEGSPPNEIYISSDAAISKKVNFVEQPNKTDHHHHHHQHSATNANMPSAVLGPSSEMPPPAYRPASLPYGYMNSAHLGISEEASDNHQEAPDERAVNKRLSPQPANLRAYGGEYISSQAGLYAAALRDLQILDEDDDDGDAAAAGGRDTQTQTRAVPVQLAPIPVATVPVAGAHGDQRMMMS
jgi:hypothetical protein